MTGMDRDTGTARAGLSHIRQSVADILTTRIGTRIMREDYGSLLPDLVDAPLTDATLLRAYSATIIALLEWEPRIAVRAIGKRIRTDRPGAVVLTLDALTVDGVAVDIDVPVGA